jgi:hypothetical protein
VVSVPSSAQNMPQTLLLNVILGSARGVFTHRTISRMHADITSDY